MKEPYVINLKKPEDSAEQIASKLNSLNGAINIEVIAGAVSKDDFEKYKKTNDKIVGGYEDRINYNVQNGRKILKDGRYHGGGDRVTAGNNVTITTNTNGQKVISSSGGGSGTVTSVSVTTANGVSGSVATSTTTPAITLSLGAITPSSVAASGLVSGSNLSGTNTGDQTNISGNAATVTVADAAGDTTTFPLLGIDATGSLSPRTDAGLTYNANTNALTTTTFIGALTGNASTVTTNANLTGVITSSGNTTSIASQTGTGTKFVVDNTPTLITPVLGVASATSVNKVAITAPATSATLTIANGATLSAPSSATVSNTNTGDQNVFSTFAVSGQSDVVADSTADTLTLVAGTNVTLTTNASTDAITINSVGVAPGAAGANTQVQFNDGGSALGADSRFAWKKSGNIGLYLGEINDAGTIYGIDASSGDDFGGGIQVITGAGFGAGKGGALSFIVGNSGDTANGGNLGFESGYGGNTSGNGGNIDFSSGSAQGGDGNGGNVFFAAGQGIGTGKGGNLIINYSRVPTSASDTGTAGAIAQDASYIYICTATNTWKRVAISTW